MTSDQHRWSKSLKPAADTRPGALTLVLFAACLLLAVAGCSVDSFYRTDNQTSGQVSTEQTLRSARSSFPAPPTLNSSELEEITRAGFRGLDWTWLTEGPLLPPNRSPSGTGTHLTEGYIQGLLKLSQSTSTEDEAALKRIQFHLASVKTPRAGTPYAHMVLAARLAAYDEGTWTSFVEDFVRHGRKDAALKDSLVPILKAMPRPLRNRLYAQINNAPLRAQLADPLHAFFQPGLYEWAMANKKDATLRCIRRRSDGQCQKMTPKRCIDAFLSGTIKMEEHFSFPTAQGGSGGSVPEPEAVLNAYESYLAAQRQTVFHNSSVGKFTAQDVYAILHGVRASLVGKWPRHAPDLSAYGHHNKPFLLAFGSIINGRGMLERNPNFKVKFQKDGSYTLNNESFSDFDMYASPLNELKVIRKQAAHAYSFLQSTLTRAHQADDSLRARFQVEAYEPHRELDSALLSPISIRLDEQGLYLLLHPQRRYSDIPHSRSMAHKLAVGGPRPNAGLGKILCFALSGNCPNVYATEEKP